MAVAQNGFVPCLKICDPVFSTTYVEKMGSFLKKQSIIFSHPRAHPGPFFYPSTPHGPARVEADFCLLAFLLVTHHGPYSALTLRPFFHT